MTIRIGGIVSQHPHFIRQFHDEVARNYPVPLTNSRHSSPEVTAKLDELEQHWQNRCAAASSPLGVLTYKQVYSASVPRGIIPHRNLRRHVKRIEVAHTPSSTSPLTPTGCEDRASLALRILRNPALNVDDRIALAELVLEAK